MADTSLTGRALQGGVAAVKGGGSIWWAFVIHGNTGDDGDSWTQYSFGNIQDISWAAYNFQTGKLLDIGAIDWSSDAGC